MKFPFSGGFLILDESEIVKVMLLGTIRNDDF